MVTDGPRVYFTEVKGFSVWPSWSKDHQYLYFLRIVGEPVICRIRLSDRRLEEVVSLKNVRCTGIMGGICWVGLAPDDAPLLLRDTGIEEIYGLDWQAP